MTTHADIAAAVLAEREACALAAWGAATTYSLGHAGDLGPAGAMIAAIRSRPAPDAEALVRADADPRLERALRACAEKAWVAGANAGLASASGEVEQGRADAGIQAAIAAGKAVIGGGG